MAVTYTWTIPSVDSKVSNGGIHTIHWRVTGVEGDYSETRYGTSSHTPDPSAAGYIAYSSVTEENCITWAKAAIDTAQIETDIENGIALQKNPVNNSGTPWS